MALNLEARQNLSDLIVNITKTGDLYLDADQVKQVKAICKRSDSNVKAAYELLMIQLQRKHAQIRYSSTQLIAEIFQRSHVFRELLVADYSIFLQLTVGIHQNKLPPPVVFAEKTKQLAISLTNEWNAKYGAVYKQIALGYEFLKYHLKVDFTNLVPVTDEARSAEQQAQEGMSKRLRRKRYEKAAAELDEKADDIQDNLRKMDSCFEILVPNIDDEGTLNAMFDAPEHTVEDDRELQQDQDLEGEEEGEGSNTEGTYLQHDPLGVRDNALGSNRYKLTISLDRDNVVDVHESEENAELFATLRECYRLIIKKHWPLVMHWLDVMMKVDQEPGESRAEYDRLLKLAIDLKKGVVEAKAKSEDLGINMDTMYGPHEQDSEEDDIEFEEVEVSASKSDRKGKRPKRNIRPAQAPRPSKNPVFAMHGAEILVDDPTYAGGTRIAPVRTVDSPLEEKQYSSSASGSRATSEAPSPPAEGGETRDDLLARAPVLPWDDDLAVWDKKEMAFNTSGLEFSHRFLGVGDGSNMVSQATLDRMKMRTRIYNPELPEVIKACRYPMSNGKLCMRRDLVRCPYHGPVVPRDEYGQIQRAPEEGGFVHEDDMLDDEQEADLIQRAIHAASSSTTSSGPNTRSSTRLPKSTSTWEDIEDDVHLALGLEKIEPKRKRGQGSSASSKKKKPPSALVNISKPADSSRSRLLKHMSSKATKDSLDQDRRGEKADLNRDSRLHQW
ncbi:hypothetical protein BGZ70_001205 [Mortierella alpina]|uniref:UV-stimulated scaffold protein A C-terminal domain-containing protein n=1 Tax=Mortierella alpina TaxID=64518 RepID=A0A9P6IWB3_MORAP|nr:hypothetical protein BGZ70_001205 [Mortierella alpina]